MDILPSVLARLFFEAMIFGGVMDLISVLVQMINVLAFGEASQKSHRGRIGRVVFYAIEDVLFCLLIAVGLLLLAFSGTNGVIRWVLPVGAFVGFFATRRTVGVIFRKIFPRIVLLLRRMIGAIVRILFCPLRLLMKVARCIRSRIFCGNIRNFIFLSRKTKRETSKERRIIK